MTEQLPLWVSLTQIIASASLALASVVVAIIATWFSYRNNFGWGPLVVGKKHWLVNAHGGASSSENLVIEFEIWNRRKYPISVHHIGIKFNKTNIYLAVGRDEWKKTGGNVFDCDLDFSLDASGHDTRTITVVLDGPERDYSADYGIWVECFDPRLEKTVTAHGRGKVYLPRAHSISWAKAKAD